MSLVGVVRAQLRRIGVDVVRYDADHFAGPRRLQLLKERGIDLVLDVGANEGQYAEALRRNGYDGRIVSFEPLASAYSDLEHRASAVPRWETRNFALGDTPGTALLHVAGNSWSSSLLPMTARQVESAPESVYVAEQEIEVRTLDGVADELFGPRDRLWLKIDTQGYEFPVLSGAEQTLDRVEVVETELSLVELYEGQVLLGEAISYLTARGFGIWFVEPVFRDPASGELLQVDTIFARRYRPQRSANT
jgi:FkbM family methyltransferase